MAKKKQPPKHPPPKPPMNPSPVSTILKLVSSTSTLSSCTLILLESLESTESTEPPDGVFLSVMAYVVFAPPKPPPPPDPPPSQAFWPDLLVGVSDSDPPDTLNPESVWISSYVPEGTLLAMVQTFTAVCSFSYKSVSVSHEMELLPLPLFQLERQVLDSYPPLMSLAYLDLDVWMLSLVERDIHQLPLRRNLPSFLNDKSANLVLIRSIDNLTLLTGLILHLNCIKHITKLPRIEACVKLPQYEDVVGLPQYEDAMRHNLFSYVFSWLSSFGFSLCCLALSDSGMCFEELISRTSNGVQHGANVLTVFPKAAGFASPRKIVLLQGLLSSSSLVEEELGKNPALYAALHVGFRPLNGLTDLHSLVTFLNGIDNEPKTSLHDTCCRVLDFFNYPLCLCFSEGLVLAFLFPLYLNTCSCDGV